MSESDVKRGMREMDENQARYLKAKRFYEGSVDEVFSSEKIAKLLSKEGKRYRVNLAKIVVKAIYNRLEVTGVTVPGNEVATNHIQEIRDTLATQIVESTVHRKTGEFGDTYVLMLPADEEELESEDEEENAEGEEVEVEETLAAIDFFYNNPLCMRIIYSEEHPDRKLFAIKRWLVETAGQDQVWRVNLYYPNTIERWISQKGQGEGDLIWLPFLSEGETSDDWPIQTDFGRIPVTHFRTDVPYGVPDHLEAYGPQNAINKLIITQMATTEAAGFPQRWALEETNNLDGGMDDPDWDDDASGDPDLVNKGGVSSGLRTGPGTLQVLQNIKSTGQYASADPRSFIEPLEVFIGLMSAATSTPMNEFKTSGQQPAGDSQREAKANLIENVKFRQLMLSASWSEFWKLVLKFSMDIDVPKIDIQWRPADSVNDYEGWQTFDIKLRLGLPIRQILIEAGYTDEELTQWGIPTFDQTDMIQDLTTTAELMQAIGLGIEKLTQAAAVGLIDQASIERIVNTVMLPAVQELKDSGE